MPDELDPQIREFTSQLRRLVDRSGLSIASVADRTGYSKTSWERYLNGRLLAPKGAIVALAEVTGTNPLHLTTMWELAERAWSRSEMRHDMTMEAIRISQARAALGEFGGQDFGDAARAAGGGRAAAPGSRPARGGSTTVTPGIAGPAGVAPSVPAQPTAPEVQDSTGSGLRESGGRSGAGDVNSWGLAGYKGPSPTGRPSGSGSRPGSGSASPSGPSSGPSGPTGPTGPSGSTGDASRPSSAGAHGGEPPRDAVPSGAGTAGAAPAAAKRRTATFVAAAVGVLVVIAGAFHLSGGGGGDDARKGGASPSPTVTDKAELPPGVKCGGAACTGKDAENMGCSGERVTTATTATVGTTVVEVRYSETCKAAWGRITGAAPGDEVRISAGKAKQSGSITEAGDTVAYTPMVAVKSAAEATACTTLAAGGEGCTK
ncbi:DUF2690 domain-containing protein [Streptomyces sp. NPDC059720]|uniref:helix-turn-helix domain-containing protein n=1 Tax=Streptomyces sp. NPDC059720 TaxID=3346924 RepID=UPI0036BF5264